jgi:hypothetical protein
VTRSAEETGMQRSNFQALMKKYDIRVCDASGNSGGGGDAGSDSGAEAGDESAPD